MILTKKKKNIIKFIENKIGYWYKHKSGSRMVFVSWFNGGSDDSQITIDFKNKRVIHTIDPAYHYESLLKYSSASKTLASRLDYKYSLAERLVNQAFLAKESYFFRQKNDWTFFENTITSDNEDDFTWTKTKYVNDRPTKIAKIRDTIDLMPRIIKAKDLTEDDKAEAKHNRIYGSLFTGYNLWEKIDSWFTDTRVWKWINNIKKFYWGVKEEIHPCGYITKKGREKVLRDRLKEQIHILFIYALDRERSTNKILYFNSPYKNDNSYIVVDFNRSEIIIHCTKGMHYQNIEGMYDNRDKHYDEPQDEPTLWEEIKGTTMLYGEKIWKFSTSKEFVVK